MVVLGTVAMVIGLSLLVLSLIFVLLGWGGRRDRRRLERPPRRTCAELLARPRGRCIVVGEIAAGPEGLNVAPVLATAVAWHRTRVWLRSRHWYMEHDAETLVWEHATLGPVALRDETGSVLVSLSLFDTDSGPQRSKGSPVQQIVDSEGDPALRQLTERGLLPASALRDARERSTKGYRVQELVLRPGAPLSVLATPRLRNGRPVLERPRLRRSLVSARTPEELHAAHAEDARFGFVAAVWCLAIGAVLVLVGWALAVALPGEAVLGWAG